MLSVAECAENSQLQPEDDSPSHFSGAIIFEGKGLSEPAPTAQPQPEVIYSRHYNDQDQAELRGKAEEAIDIKGSVDSMVYHLAGLWKHRNRQNTNDWDIQADFAVRSMIDLAEYLDDRGMKLTLMLENRGLRKSPAEPQVKPVRLDSWTRRSHMVYVGEVPFLEVCKAIALDDQVKVTQPGREQDGRLVEGIYSACLRDVELEWTKDVHLGPAERRARGREPKTPLSNLGFMALHSA